MEKGQKRREKEQAKAEEKPSGKGDLHVGRPEDKKQNVGDKGGALLATGQGKKSPGEGKRGRQRVIRNGGVKELAISRFEEAAERGRGRLERWLKNQAKSPGGNIEGRGKRVPLRKGPLVAGGCVTRLRWRKTGLRALTVQRAASRGTCSR